MGDRKGSDDLSLVCETLVVCRIEWVTVTVVPAGMCVSDTRGKARSPPERVSVTQHAFNHRVMAAESSKRSKLIDVYVSYTRGCVVLTPIIGLTSNFTYFCPVMTHTQRQSKRTRFSKHAQTS